MIVRPGRPADAPALAALRDITDVPPFAAWMAAHAESHLPFVAEQDGQVVGSAWLHLVERVPSAESAARLSGDVQSVMVVASHRNHGVGAALMRAILAEAGARGLQLVTVHSGRRAVDFYARNGFAHHRQLLLWEPGTTG
jgi:GNAT superfamily N-acetyltransferase